MNSKPVSVTLPTQLAPGEYLVRQEIIGLHLAVTLGGAEFYPSCTQVRIGGSQSGTPNQTVSFPGAYNDNDPGIYVPNIYAPGASYNNFPGPPVSNLASPADMSGQLSGNGSSSPGGNTYSSSTAKGGKPTSTSGAGSGAQPTAQSPLNRVCKLQKRDAPLSQRDVGTEFNKRHMSFMRAIRDAFYHS